MSRIHLPRGGIVRYALVAALAFTLGSATVVTAGPVVSGFVGLIDGTNTAAINASRELAVTDAMAQAALVSIAADTSQLSFDASGNLKTTSQATISGTVNVGNFPATQNVNGSVNVANLPATQNVSGTVGLATTANTVKIDPANNGRTFVVLTIADPGGTPVPSTGLVRVFDGSPYERIRVTAGNICTSTATVLVGVRNNDAFGTLIDFYPLAPCTTQDKVYDLPGVSLDVEVSYTGGATSGAKIFLRVLGR